MWAKKLIAPKAVTIYKSLVFVLSRVPLSGRETCFYLLFFFPSLFWVEIFPGN